MAAETGRRTSRLELIRARLHESGRRPRCDVTSRTPTSGVRSTADHDVRQSPLPGRDTVTHNGLRPVPRPPDPRGTKRDGRVQPGNTNHDRAQVPASRQTEVKIRPKLDAGVDRQLYAQVRKPLSAATSTRGSAGVEDTAQGRDDSVPSGPRRPAQKTSSSSSLLSKSQNFFARLRSRKNDPAKTSSDGASGSTTKIRRSVSESGCAIYTKREPLTNDITDNLDTVTSSGDVTSDAVCDVDRPETVSRDVGVNLTNTTTRVYTEAEPSTSRTSTASDVIQSTDSTSGPVRVECCPVPTEGYGECAGSYSLREALLQRGGDTAVTQSTTSSHIIRQEPSTSSPDDVTLLRASLMPVGGVAPGAGSSTTVTGWRRRGRLSTALSAGSIVGGRRDGRLERIQEVDSPPGGSADDGEMTLRSPPRAAVTQPGSEARNCKFIACITTFSWTSQQFRLF